jgi:hypothetical protein
MLTEERLSVKVISRADLAAHRQYPFIRHVLQDGVAVHQNCMPPNDIAEIVSFSTMNSSPHTLT